MARTKKNARCTGNEKRAAGIVRRIDSLGRVVIPKEFRKSLGIQNGHAVEMTISNGKISIRSYEDVAIKSLEEYTEKELMEELERRSKSKVKKSS